MSSHYPLTAPAGGSLDLPQLDLDEFEQGPFWLAAHRGAILEALSAIGTRRALRLFDRLDVGPAPVCVPQVAAARLALILRHCGIPATLAVLDSALVAPAASTPDRGALLEGGRELRDSPPEVTGGGLAASIHDGSMPSNTAFDGALLIDFETLQARLNPRHNVRLLDVRSRAEFEGLCRGYAYVARAGRIPAAEHLDVGRYPVTDPQIASWSLQRLREACAARQLDLQDPIICYCGTSWRASLMALMLQSLGFTRVSVYEGGWHEWQRRDGSSA